MDYDNYMAALARVEADRDLLRKKDACRAEKGVCLGEEGTPFLKVVLSTFTPSEISGSHTEGS
jgi:hypothetical protein